MPVCQFVSCANHSDRQPVWIADGCVWGGTYSGAWRMRQNHKCQTEGSHRPSFIRIRWITACIFSVTGITIRSNACTGMAAASGCCIRDWTKDISEEDLNKYHGSLSFNVRKPGDTAVLLTCDWPFRQYNDRSDSTPWNLWGRILYYW